MPIGITRLLLVIKVPPPNTGATLMNLYVKNSNVLNKDFNIESIDISYSKNIDEFGIINLTKFFLFFKYLLMLIRELIIFKPDLVYFQLSPTGIALYRDLIYCFIIKIFNRKILFHLHGKGIEQEVKKNRLVKKFVTMSLKNEYVVCLSSLVKQDIIGVYYANPFIVSDGIEKIDAKYIDAPRFTNSTGIILYYSNFSKNKGLLILIDALRKLKNENVKFKAIISGRRADFNFDQVKSLIECNHLTYEVELLEDISLELKYKLFNKADIFVFPTIFEAFGTVVLEAMQFSLPVVASDEGSLPIIIDDGMNGLLFKNGNATDLAQKLELLLKDEKKRRQYGQNGRIKYEKYFTLDLFEKNMDMVFKQVLEKSSQN